MERQGSATGPAHLVLMYGIKLLTVRTNYPERQTITAMLRSSFASNNTMVFVMKILSSRRKHGQKYIKCIAGAVGGSHATWMVRICVEISQSTVTY